MAKAPIADLCRVFWERISLFALGEFAPATWRGFLFNENTFKRFKEFHLKNVSSQGRNPAWTVLHVLNADRPLGRTDKVFSPRTLSESKAKLTYRVTSLIRNRHPPKDVHRALGIGLP